MSVIIARSAATAGGGRFHWLHGFFSVTASAWLLRCENVIVITASSFSLVGSWHIGMFHQRGKRTASRIITPLGIIFSGGHFDSLRANMPDTASILLDNLEAFTRFARARLGDPELARDAVQESLLKAIEANRQPTEGQEIPWFYRILRRTIIDLYRRREARQRAMTRYEPNIDRPIDAEETKMLCACFERLIPELPSQYQELLRRVDLEGASPTTLARQRGVTSNALTVQLHRARARLRGLLKATCKVCATHGCMDCNCAEERGR